MTESSAQKYPKGTPRKHHFVPKSYLAGFCAAGTERLAVYDRERNQFRDRQHITEVAHIKDYYAIEVEDGPKDFGVEAWLSTLESDAVKVIRLIDQGQRISDEDKQLLALYAAFQFTRTPTYQDRTDSLGEAIVLGKMNELFKDEATARETMTAPEFSQSGLSPSETVELVKKLDVVILRVASLDAMLNNAPKFAEGLLGLDWFILRRPNDKTAFITTDSPFTLVPGPRNAQGPYGVGLLTPGVTKILPLSQSCALLMRDRGWTFADQTITRDEVRWVNKQMANHCRHLVFGRDGRQLKRIVGDTGIDTRKWQSYRAA